MKVGTEVRNECVNLLDNTHSICLNGCMRLGDIRKRLFDLHKDSAERLAAIHSEQNEIRSVYQRYLDLELDARRYEKRMVRAVAALREQRETENIDESIRSGKNVASTIALPIDVDGVPLWEIITAILTVSGEVQVVELASLLEFLGFRTTRSAIESSLKTHPNDFRIRESGRSKVVSLQGAA
jgi:hypothetical protein